jgi:type VI secretion system secreted protein Hcp
MLKIGYLTIEGEASGVVTGPSVYSMAPDTIEVLDVQHMVTHEYDQNHGTPTGDRHHQPFMIVKAVDVTTPTLCDMCTKAELILSAKLMYYVQTGASPDPVEFFSWTLTNAYITHVRQIPAMELGGEYAEQYDLLEEVAMSYQQMEWQHYQHRSPIGLKDLEQKITADAWSSTQGAQ